MTASVPENSLPGTPVALVSASDSDDGDNGRISIFIIGGDPRSQFKVNDVSLYYFSKFVRNQSH